MKDSLEHISSKIDRIEELLSKIYEFHEVMYGDKCHELKLINKHRSRMYEEYINKLNIPDRSIDCEKRHI